MGPSWSGCRYLKHRQIRLMYDNILAVYGFDNRLVVSNTHRILPTFGMVCCHHICGEFGSKRCCFSHGSSPSMGFQCGLEQLSPQVLTSFTTGAFGDSNPCEVGWSGWAAVGPSGAWPRLCGGWPRHDAAHLLR